MNVDQKKILKLKVEYNDDNYEIIELDQSISQPEANKVELKSVVSTNHLKITIVDSNKPDMEHMLLFNL